MKLKITPILISLFLLLAACGNKEVQDESFSSYQPEQFDITLFNTAEQEVHIAPTAKTIYVYFTGVD